MKAKFEAFTDIIGLMRTSSSRLMYVNYTTLNGEGPPFTLRPEP